jgi:hypothetical protein
MEVLGELLGWSQEEVAGAVGQRPQIIGSLSVAKMEERSVMGNSKSLEPTLGQGSWFRDIMGAGKSGGLGVIWVVLKKCR